MNRIHRDHFIGNGAPRKVEPAIIEITDMPPSGLGVHIKGFDITFNNIKYLGSIDVNLKAVSKKGPGSDKLDCDIDSDIRNLNLPDISSDNEGLDLKQE